MRKQIRNNVIDNVRATIPTQIPHSQDIYEEDQEEQHVNITRYVNGICPKYREKQMQIQLRTLLDVNDGYTLPNPNGSGAKQVRSRVVFPRLISRRT